MNRGEPAIPIADLAVDVREVLLLNALGARTALPAANRDAVDAADGRDFGGRTREEDFVGNVERFAGNERLDNLVTEVSGDANHAVARDACEDGCAQGWRVDAAVAHQEDVLA